MAYNSFTLNKLKADFGINHLKKSFLPTTLPAHTSSQRLLDAEGMPLASEKAKSEPIVKPVLMEIIRLNRHKILMFSGYALDVDKAKKRGASADC